MDDIKNIDEILDFMEKVSVSGQKNIFCLGNAIGIMHNAADEVRAEMPISKEKLVQCIQMVEQLTVFGYNSVVFLGKAMEKIVKIIMEIEEIENKKNGGVRANHLPPDNKSREG